MICSFPRKLYLFAMLDYAKAGGASRGSALYTDPEGELPGFEGCEPFGELYRCKLDRKDHGKEVQEVVLKDGEVISSRRPVRPIPDVDYFFENQWRAYRKRTGNRTLIIKNYKTLKCKNKKADRQKS